jgi:hypothetical protein
MRCSAAVVRRRPRAAIAAALAAILCAGFSPAIQAEPSGPAAHGTAIPGLTSRITLETAAGGTVTQASFSGKWLVSILAIRNVPMPAQRP